MAIYLQPLHYPFSVELVVQASLQEIHDTISNGPLVFLLDSNLFCVAVVFFFLASRLVFCKYLASWLVYSSPSKDFFLEHPPG